MNKIEIIYAQIECMAGHAKNIRQMVDELMEQKQASSDVIIDGRGLYEMRNGKDAVIVALSREAGDSHPYEGSYVDDDGDVCSDSWNAWGKVYSHHKGQSPFDIVKKIRSF